MKITNFGPGGLPVAVSGWSSGIVSLNSNVEITGGGPAALNFVQRITSNTSNTLLNPIVNFASGSNIAFSVNSNTLTITGAAGGGGSGTPATTVTNETTWGITPAVGVNTEYARQDHTHGSPATPAGELLISDTPSTPLVFADIIQNEAQDDFLYAG